MSLLGKVTVAVSKFAVFKNANSATGFVTGANTNSTKMLPVHVPSERFYKLVNSHLFIQF